MNKNAIKNVAILFLVLVLFLNPVSATHVYALNAPGLLAPSNSVTTTASDTPPLAVPEFKWAAVSGATSYRLQVSSDIAFTTRIVDVTTPNTSYTPNNSISFADGIWYWRVRVEIPTPVSAYSDIWTFTKQWASFDNAPILNSPGDGETVDFYDPPIFSWTPVTGAAKYKLQIYSSPGGWSSLVALVTTLYTTHQPATKLANGTYYWRVVPVDTGNHDGTPSAERSFVAGYNFVPILLEPAGPGGTTDATPTFTPTLRWTAVRGAQYYELQYTTDPGFSTGIIPVNTRNTAYTPTNTIPNDVNYYWRVRTHSGNSISNWSSTGSFIKRWYIQPVALTPTDGYQDARFPMYSWTPVPGAAKYFVEISKYIGFNPIYDSGFTANTFYSPAKYDGAQQIYYWRVTPYDGDGRPGKASDTVSYQSYYDSVAPQLVYPLYYYPPDTYANFPGVTTNPHEDRTVPLPIFIWHRVYVPALTNNQGQVYAQAYRLQVSTDPNFGSLNWAVDTENQVATPTVNNPFTPAPNTDYYWRVAPLISGTIAGPWSQVWKTRFDATRGLAPTANPTLIRPTTGAEFAETTPLLEWFAINGASSYDVQISRDENFTNIVDSATVTYPAYASTQSLAQRSLGDVNFGVYYWRVRNHSDATWSEIRRFQIAAQSQWKFTRTLGDTANQLQIGSDPGSDVTSAYDLTTLQAAQSSSSWFFGFNVPNSPDVTYALYLDLDHQAGSGATSDARGYTVTTVSAYRPEYAIYVVQQAGAVSADKVYIYKWGGSAWNALQALNTVGGQINKSGNYVELRMPNTSIGYQSTTGSYAVSLFSLLPGGGQPQDSVPSDPNIPGAGPISRFSNVTERMNLLMPPSNPGLDTTIYPSIAYPSILPFFWDWPVLAPWSGAIMKAYRDAQFTTESATYTLTSDTAYYAQTSHSWGDDFDGDNSYYWRIQPSYRDAGCSPLCQGAWSQGWRFERKGFVPQNLQASVSFATPTFSWDMVEGAESYDLQVDDDPGFGTPAIGINTKQNSYTDTATLGNGSYYWRVSVRRNGAIINKWSAVQSFVLTLPVPTNLTPNSVNPVVPKAPTLCWNPVLQPPSPGTPVLAAWKYRVQVSKDPSFSTIWDSNETEQRCWTPTKGYDDGDYYWHVAMIDGSGSKLGNYSPNSIFRKQYLTPSLISPTSGGRSYTTPTFIWTPVNGAAKYRFEASLYPTFTPLYDGTITTDNTRWTPTKTYSSSGTYYWRVAIVDADGKVGPYVGSTIIVGSTFADVPTTYWAWEYIERLAAAGITGGCGGGNYCPTATVTRDQMAIFLLRSKYGSAYAPPKATGIFGDVPTTYWAADWIERLAAEGVTGGCGGGNYCPTNPVTRDQMAIFLVRNFNLP